MTNPAPSQIKLDFALYKVTVRDLRDAFEQHHFDWDNLNHTEKTHLVGAAQDALLEWGDCGTLEDLPRTPQGLEDVLLYAIELWKEATP